MPKIDPRDVLPQSNLPVPSVPWGRAMQARLQGVEERVLIDKQDIQGQNRTTAAQLAAISEQLQRIHETTTTEIREINFTQSSTGIPYPYYIHPPSWASYGLVVSSMTLLSGTGSGSATIVTNLDPLPGSPLLNRISTFVFGPSSLEGDNLPTIVPASQNDPLSVSFGLSSVSGTSLAFTAVSAVSVTWLEETPGSSWSAFNTDNFALESPTQKEEI